MGDEKEQMRDFSFEMDWMEDLAFNVKWDFYDAPDLYMDEPPSMGGSGKGPNAARTIVAAVANCLSASLVFCLQKSRADPKDVKVRCYGQLTRNEQGRLRLTYIKIEPVVTLPDDDLKKLERCLGMFEDFCIVTSAVRDGIDVDVQVYRDDGEGNVGPVDKPE
jgi:uncharacterized OsmC-like protein